MGLFSSIFKAIPVVGDILSASSSKKAVNKANAATQAAIQNATNLLNQQFNATSANLSPWITGGQHALGGQEDLLGLNGGDAQSGAISALQSSPLFQSLMRGGQDILLNNASATGGLRGGNFQRSLADFSADTLTKVIQNQLENLGGISSQGLSAGNALGQLGSANASSLASLATGAGQANAGAILNKQGIDNNLFSGLRQTVQSAIMGGLGGGGGLTGSNFASGTPSIFSSPLPGLNLTPNLSALSASLGLKF